ncbi:aldo/keto reductase [Candidatus Binatia bacterium]|jgi:aryl-alcohol dehydrogenase-like predicted oxidoreductase|nr:aldo/keto reductase [Candidatus Binatia bacterium]
MKRRRLGRTGLLVSEICLGTMTFGSMADEATSRRILDQAVDAGVDFLDVAEVYPVPPDPKWAGTSEEIVGRWLQGRPREALFLATKIAGPGGGWFQTPVRHGRTALDRHSIARAVDASLKRLGTDYIDLYQTHWPDPELPIEETLEGLARVIEAGKVRAVGCSNETAHGLMKSLWGADRRALPRYETIQNNFSLLNRRFEDALAEVCRREHVSLLPYSPIGGGVLSGKYLDDARPAKARFTFYAEHSPRTQAMTKRFVNEKTLESTRRFAAIAREAGMAPVTLAVAWSLAHDFVGSTIIGATAPEQLPDALAATDVELPGDVLRACDAVSREILYPMG